MRKESRCLAIVAAVGMLAAAGEAAAQSCANEIALLAQQYALSPELPQPKPDSGQSGSLGVPPEDMSKSGGVIAPPEGARGRVLEPPRQDDPMVTTPEVRPQTQDRGANIEPLRPDARAAAQRAQMQSLLDAARAAQKRGDEAECLERIARARAIPDPG